MKRKKTVKINTITSNQTTADKYITQTTIKKKET